MKVFKTYFREVIKECPECSSIELLKLDDINECVTICCGTCGYKGKTGINLEQAYKFWNQELR